MLLPDTGAYAERLAPGAGALFYTAGPAGDGRDEEAGTAALAELFDLLLEEPERLGKVRARLPAPGDFLTSIERHVALSLGIYMKVIASGAPTAPELDWWCDRMQMENEKAWDESLGRTSPEELGFV
jgi:hypothetical protein